jgi:hypothetical protein
VSDERSLGVALYNGTWELFDNRESDDDLIHMAHASAYHWRRAPEWTVANGARSEWLCARVYSVIGRAEPALHHAQRCLELVEGNPDAMDDWDLAGAYEAVARAQLVAGNREAAAKAAAAGRAALEQISDEEDRIHIERDLDSLDL